MYNKKIAIVIIITIILLVSKTNSFLSFFITEGFLGKHIQTIPLHIFQDHITNNKQGSSKLLCMPCQGSIYIYPQQIFVELYPQYSQTYERSQQPFTHTLDRKIQNHFQIIASHNQTQVTVIRSMMTGDDVAKYVSWINRQPVDGIKWQWNIYFPQQGIQIKSSIIQHTFIITLICFLFSGVMLFTIKLLGNKKHLQDTNKQLIYRANTIGLYLTLINQFMLTFYIGFILVCYLLDSKGFFLKLLYYGCLVIPLSSCLGFCAIFMGAFVRSFRKLIQNRMASLTIFLISFFFVLLYPFLLSYWSKSQFYLYFTTLPIIIQYTHSIITKKFPYLRYIIFCILQTLFLMFLQKFMPIFHFQQVTPIQMIDVILILILEFVIGNILIKKIIISQTVNITDFNNKTRDSMYDISQTQKQKNTVTNQNFEGYQITNEVKIKQIEMK